MWLALVYFHKNVENISLLYPHLPGLVSQNLNTTTPQLYLPLYFPTLSLLTYKNFSNFLSYNEYWSFSSVDRSEIFKNLMDL